MRKDIKDTYSNFKKIILHNTLVTADDIVYEKELENIYKRYETLFYNNSQLLQIWDCFKLDKKVKAICIYLYANHAVMFLRNGDVCLISIFPDEDIIIDEEIVTDILKEYLIQDSTFNLFEINLDNIKDEWRKRDLDSRFISRISSDRYLYSDIILCISFYIIFYIVRCIRKVNFFCFSFFYDRTCLNVYNSPHSWTCHCF